MRATSIPLICIFGLFAACKQEPPKPVANVSIPADAPPEPNFSKPVDYVGWANIFMRADRPLEWSTRFDAFWIPDQDPAAPPTPDWNLREKLKERIAGPAWESGTWPELEALMKKAARDIDVLVDAIDQPGEYWHRMIPDAQRPHDISSVRLPGLSTPMDLMQCRIAWSWRQQPHQANEMIESARLSLQLAQHYQSTNFLMFAATASRFKSQVYSFIRNAALSDVTNASNVQEFLQLLDSADPGPIDLEPLIVSEWAGLLSILQTFFPNHQADFDRIEQYGFLSKSGNSQSLSRADVRRIAAGPEEYATLIHHHHAKLKKIAKMPLGADQLDAIHKYYDEIQQHPGFNNLFFQFFHPSMLYSFETRLKTASDRQITRIVLKIALYFDANEQWPTSLDQAGVSKDDQIDPATGEVFDYQVGKTDNGSGFVITSTAKYRKIEPLHFMFAVDRTPTITDAAPKNSVLGI